MAAAHGLRPAGEGKSSANRRRVAVRLTAPFEDLEHLGSEFSGDPALQTLQGLPALYGRNLDASIEAYLAYIEGHKLFGKANTLATAQAPLIAGLRSTKAEIDVSTSHCIRLHVEEPEAKRLMRQFRASLARPYWRDADRTERA